MSSLVKYETDVRPLFELAASAPSAVRFVTASELEVAWRRISVTSFLTFRFINQSESVHIATND